MQVLRSGAQYCTASSSRQRRSSSVAPNSNRSGRAGCPCAFALAVLSQVLLGQARPLWGYTPSRRLVAKKMNDRAFFRRNHSTMGNTPMSPEEAELVKRIRAHQEKAVKLTRGEEARNLVQYSSGFGVISTNSKKFKGYPGSSIVGFGLDEKGRPLFAVSSMSAHTGELEADSHMSIAIMAGDFKVPDEEHASVREMYLARHPDAFWIDFDDFSLMRMDSIEAIRFIGGFGAAWDVNPEEYMSASPDPVAKFAVSMTTHMNDDHPDATKAMVEHYITGGTEVRSAAVTGVDRLGIWAVVTLVSGKHKRVRLPFPRPATERKDVRALVIEMTRAAKEAAAAGQAQT